MHSGCELSICSSRVDPGRDPVSRFHLSEQGRHAWIQQGFWNRLYAFYAGNLSHGTELSICPSGTYAGFAQLDATRNPYATQSAGWCTNGRHVCGRSQSPAFAESSDGRSGWNAVFGATGQHGVVSESQYKPELRSVLTSRWGQWRAPCRESPSSKSRSWFDWYRNSFACGRCQRSRGPR